MVSILGVIVSLDGCWVMFRGEKRRKRHLKGEEEKE
jgi:hypothetical protein